MNFSINTSAQQSTQRFLITKVEFEFEENMEASIV